jgi:polysaccharide biosynthesis protein PslJ
MADSGRIHTGFRARPQLPATAVEQGPGPAARTDRRSARRRIDTVTLLSCYLFLLMAIPSALVVGSFGAAGAPAALFAAVLFCYYLVARQHPALPLNTQRQPVRVAIMLFACVVIAAYISANRSAMPGLEKNGADRGLILLAGWLGLVLLATDGIHRLERLQVLLRRIVLGATALSAMGAVEFFTGLDVAKYIWVPGLTLHTQVTDLISRDGLHRVAATAAEPLELAAVLAMSLPLAIHQARFAPPQLRNRRWLQVALISGGTLLTVSRSTIFALAVIALVLFPTWSKRERQRAYWALVASVSLIWLARPGLLTTVGGLFGQLGTDQSSKSRTNAYSEAAPYIVHHPWLGQGFGTFLPQTYFFVDNQYLTSVLEIGFVGVTALVALFVIGWFTARGARRRAADAEGRDLGQCLAASVAAAAVCFGTFDALSFSIAPGLCFLILGCVGAAWRLARARQQAEIAGLPPL